MTDRNSTPSTLQEYVVDGVIVLRVERGLKGLGETTLKERLDVLVRDGHLEILIDMKDMPFVDSSELGRLIRSHLSVRQAGGRVRLCNLAPRVVALMKMTRLDTILELYDTETQALASIRQARGERVTQPAAGTGEGLSVNAPHGAG